jgi:tripartite-type tricarboxylate transporter receptor subunit TctC
MKISVCMAAALLASTNVLAQGYPSKPLKLIVPFPVGTAPDIIGRLVAQGMGEGLGQQMIVENRVGAAGTIGTAAAAAAPPDGYTLHLTTTGSLAIGPALFPNAGFDPVRSFAPISQISTAPVVLVVAASVPVASVAELLDYSRARPGKLNYGSPGSGTIPHILMECSSP